MENESSDTTKWIIQGEVGVGVAMGNAIDGNGANIPLVVKAVSAEHGLQLVADLLFVSSERRAVYTSAP